VDWASLVLQIFDHVVNGVTASTIPAAIPSRMTVVIVEELCIWVSLVCPFESLADEVFHISVDFAPWSVGSDFVWCCVINSLIDDIPGKNSAFVPSNSGLDVPLGKVLDLLGIATPKEAWVVWVLVPKGGVTSVLNVVLRSPVHNVITLGVVEVVPVLGNRLHLAVALRRDEIIILLDRVHIFLIDHAVLNVPVVDGCTNVYSKTLGVILESIAICLVFNVATEQVGNRHIANCVHLCFIKFRY